MNLATVRVDDIVRCRVRGAEFYALVRERDDDGLRVRPIDRSHLPRGAAFDHVTARQVVEVWRKRRARAATSRRPEHEAAL